MAGNKIQIVATAKDEVSGPLAKMRDQFNTLGKNKGFQAVAQGVGIGTGIAALGGLAAGIHAVSGFLQDSATAYREEQTSMAGLDASLRANIAGYDGNASSIEAVLKSRMKLGFSDEEQRLSMQALIGATHNVTDALNIERIALDLAAFKHIDLATATDLLVKVQAGSFRALKGLGIETKGVTNSMQALDLIQKVVAGSAEALAQTDEGKLKIASINVNEAQEKLGKSLSKLQAEVLPALADGLTTVVDNMDRLSIAFNFLTGQIPNAMTQLEMYNLAHKDEALAALVAAHAEDQSTASIIQNEIDKAKAAANAATDTADAADVVDKAYEDWKKSGVDTMHRIYAAQQKVMDQLKTLADTAISEYFGPIITADRLAADEAEINAQRRIIASKTATAAEKRDAKARLHELQQSVTEERVSLALAGKLNKTEQTRLLKDLETALATSTGQAKQDIADLITALGGIPQNIPVNINVHTNTSLPKPHRPGGHPSSTPPHSGGGRRPAANTGGPTININSVFPPSPQHAAQILRFIKDGLATDRELASYSPG